MLVLRITRMFHPAVSNIMRARDDLPRRGLTVRALIWSHGIFVSDGNVWSHPSGPVAYY